ncbi:MAG: tripartite tricarboxylate transporter permease, partial [Thermosphaera sp.]
GGIAAFFPIITGGMGALVGGHMASSRGDDTFLISQGAARTVYYTGALFFLFHPTMRITRGSVAWLVGGVYTPKTWAEFYAGAAFIILAAAVSFVITLYLSKAVARLLTRISYVYISAATLVFLISLVYYLTGPVGLVLMLAATSVGFAAMVFNTRLSYCLGSLILPVLANTMGFAGFFLELLGLGG